jgi:hypothetical protein
MSLGVQAAALPDEFHVFDLACVLYIPFSVCSGLILDGMHFNVIESPPA